MQALIESEMEQIDRDEIPSGEEYCQLHFSEINEGNDMEGSGIDIQYGDQNLDFDENEKEDLNNNIN